MATHPSDVDVNTQACVGLTACVRQMAPEERAEFAKRAVPVIVAAVGSRMVDPNLMGAGLMTLSILCRVEFSGPHGRQLALSNGGVGIAAAKNAMVNCKGMAAVQKEGIALLCSLVEANDLVGRHGVLQMCMPPFLFAMRAHKDDDNVQPGATLLAGLASGCMPAAAGHVEGSGGGGGVHGGQARARPAQFACCHVLMLMAQGSSLNKFPQAVVAVDAVPALLVAAALPCALGERQALRRRHRRDRRHRKSDDKGREATAGAEAAWLDAPGSIAGNAAGQAARAGRPRVGDGERQGDVGWLRRRRRRRGGRRRRAAAGWRRGRGRRRRQGGAAAAAATRRGGGGAVGGGGSERGSGGARRRRGGSG